MTRDEYEEAREFIDGLGYHTPDAHALHRGGIIGTVEVLDVVTNSESPWFFGPRGLVLKNQTPVPFIPAKGALGYFEWQHGAWSDVPKPAAWMLPKPPKMTATIMATQPLPLFDDERG